MMIKDKQKQLYKGMFRNVLKLIKEELRTMPSVYTLLPSCMF